MKLFVLTALTMIAFAANSVLNRMGLDKAGMDPLHFGTIRLFAGALTLAVLALILRRGLQIRGPGRVLSVLSLIIYIYGFSIAYVMLDAGLGALILFGMVQVTMFAGAVLNREAIPPLRWLGAGVAFAGLVWLLWPREEVSVPLFHASMMVLAGVGWGVYSLVGRKATDALQATAANFLLAAPIGLGLGFLRPAVSDISQFTTEGVALAILSGAITSGLGYALWYSLIPALGAGRAAVAQLSVPVIAIAGGAVFLAEWPDLRFVIAALIVLGGVGLSLRAK
ncbi:DMT family transporter [Thalassovita sp.]|jgi:drug/metabolite transporter (DMT)-like permease|uniref:DMT family transporter n=1 Tax=Thalassovita sp. TaxID=1979401 RepID=UPI003B5BC873